MEERQKNDHFDQEEIKDEDIIEDTEVLNEDTKDNEKNDDSKPSNEDLEEASVKSAEASDEELKEETDIDEMKKLLQEKENQCADLLDRLQRTMAEFDNFRKRTIKEKTSLFDDGVRSTIEQILPVIDNFERALSSNTTEDESNPYLQGMEMIYRQFKDILAAIGVEEIKTIGEKFNPDFHNAVMHIEDEAYGENEIVEEFQKGYIYKDKVIRYSMVKVAN